VRSPVIPSQWRAAKRFAPVLGHQMAYVEAGTGWPIVLLHDNPTSVSVGLGTVRTRLPRYGIAEVRCTACR